MSKKRLQVYADDETKRRIELAAMIREVAVTDYCLDAIRVQLADDDVLEPERVEVRLRAPKPEALATELRALHERILARRGGRLIDLDVLTSVREERDDELAGLR